MPLATLSPVAARAVAADRRIFGTAPRGIVWCVPADLPAAAWYLDLLRCDALGPWGGHIGPDRLVLEPGGELPIVAWHVSTAAFAQLADAGLLDPDRAAGA